MKAEKHPSRTEATLRATQHQATAERSVMDVSHIEAVESRLDAFIAQRDKQRRKVEGERPHEGIYAESCRRFDEEQRQRRLQERFYFHVGQARRLTVTLGVLIAGHEREAQKYAELLGMNTQPKGAA
jgi:hypothetical protein